MSERVGSKEFRDEVIKNLDSKRYINKVVYHLYI